MENSADKYIGRILDDRYEIIELIGSGGMANVYKALCHRLNRYDAVKIMRDETAANTELRRRFCAESQAVAMLSHPNIVSVYDVSHSDDVEYIVMELIEGITLKQYLQKKVFSSRPRFWISPFKLQKLWSMRTARASSTAI